MSKLILFCLSLLSCASPRGEITYNTFSYTSIPKNTESIKLSKRLFVKNCEDIRLNENNSYEYLKIIPLMPFGATNANKPDISTKYLMDFNPQSDLSKALAIELDSYTVFSQVAYSDRIIPRDADYILNCKISKNQIYSRDTVFGISILPAVNGAIFLPILVWAIINTDFANLTAELSLEIHEMKTKKIIYKKSFRKTNSSTTNDLLTRTQG